MTRASREPLTHEERELANRLARLGASGGPPPALDARILAVARDGVARAQANARRRRARWPLAFGAVAMLVLAVGIAWQLRPAAEEETAFYSKVAAPIDAARSSGPGAVADPPFESVQEIAPAVASPPPPAPPAPVAPMPVPTAPEAPPAAADTAAAGNIRRRAPAPSPAAEIGSDSAAPAAVAEDAQARAERAERAAEIVFDAPAPAPAPEQAPAAQALSPAAPPVPAARSLRTPQHGAAAVKVQPAPSASAAYGEAAKAREERDNAGFSDAAIDDQPPATADSPAVQRAWLQRIRELLANGDEDGARASLAEFKRRYPRYALPDDLRDYAP